MNKWIKYNKAPTQIRQCLHDQIIPPRLGQNRVVIGALADGIVLFWFANTVAPVEYMIVPRPEGW